MSVEGPEMGTKDNGGKDVGACQPFVGDRQVAGGKSCCLSVVTGPEGGFYQGGEGSGQCHNRVGLSFAGDYVLQLDGPWASHPSMIADVPIDLFVKMKDGREYVLTLTPEVVERLVGTLRSLGLPIEERPYSPPKSVADMMNDYVSQTETVNTRPVRE